MQIYQNNLICKLCGETVSLDKRKCKYCGRIVNDDNNDSNGDSLNLENTALEDKERSLKKSTEDNSYKENISIDKLNSKPIYTDNININNPSNRNNSNNTESKYNNLDGKRYNSDNKKEYLNKLTNSTKVFIISSTSILPLIGQTIGAIIATIYMCSEKEDKKSFGVSLLINSLILFLVHTALVIILIPLISKD